MGMTQKQRFLAAVRRETPDVVPVAPLIHNRYAHRLLHQAGWRPVYEIHRLIGSCHHRGPLGVGYDVDWDRGDGWSEENGLAIGPAGEVIRTTTTRTPLGDLTTKRVSGIIPDDPLVGKVVEYPVKDPERDWPIYQAYMEEWLARATTMNVTAATDAHKVMGENGLASVGVGSVYGRLGNARGMQELLLDFHDYPGLVADVQETAWRVQAKVLDAFLASPSELCFYDICWATGSDMSPRMFERWVVPEVQRAVAQVHAVPGKHIGLYTLGKIRQALPMLVEAGVDFVETFEPNQGDIGLAEAKRLYGDRICLMGNFDCVVLAMGSVDDARREARRCLREAMEGGGYVLVTGDEVPADAKLDNLKAMVETVEEYGRY